MYTGVKAGLLCVCNFVLGVFFPLALLWSPPITTEQPSHNAEGVLNPQQQACKIQFTTMQRRLCCRISFMQTGDNNIHQLALPVAGKLIQQNLIGLAFAEIRRFVPNARKFPKRRHWKAAFTKTDPESCRNRLPIIFQKRRVLHEAKDAITVSRKTRWRRVNSI